MPKSIIQHSTPLNLEVKDVDFSSRMVTFYASVFDNIDAHKDIIRKGAFAKTIKERGPQGKNRIAHCYQHFYDVLLGRVEELLEDDTGLLVRSYMSKSTTGQDALIQYDEKILREHSIGFEVESEGKEEIESEAGEVEVNVIKEIKLWEVSTVTWGANELAKVKQKAEFQAKEKEPADLIEEIKNISNFVRSAKASDQSLGALELKLKTYQGILQEVLAKAPPSLEQPAPPPSKQENKVSGVLTVKQDIVEFYNRL